MKITLDSLQDGIPVMTKAAADFYRENCMVCLHKRGHQSGVTLTIHYSNDKHMLEVHWIDEVTEQMLKAYADVNKTTDFGACAIALLLVRELTEYTAIEQSNTGTTIDYYLAPQQLDDTLIFNQALRLEVSGILAENEGNTVESRINQKLRRLKQQINEKTFIVVVEFSTPYSKMVNV